ncbi:beta-galactosidase [Anopheles sinensis]|uniref:Beta-galactosidase n=1 Tax=Anopheles sinensis TaxID=74873 RepID=A0A084VCG0_ANOSI|nr:beta-galactosidase [Anopheles sinensis]
MSLLSSGLFFFGWLDVQPETPFRQKTSDGSTWENRFRGEPLFTSSCSGISGNYSVKYYR